MAAGEYAGRGGIGVDDGAMTGHDEIGGHASHRVRAVTKSLSTDTSTSLERVLAILRSRAPELRRRGVVHVAVFGSVARQDDRPDSDVDVLVELEPEVASDPRLRWRGVGPGRNARAECGRRSTCAVAPPCAAQRAGTGRPCLLTRRQSGFTTSSPTSTEFMLIWLVRRTPSTSTPRRAMRWSGGSVPGANQRSRTQTRSSHGGTKT